MLSACKYRLYPKPEQELWLNRSLLALCGLYNRLRARKIDEYKQNHISLSKTGLRDIALRERRCDPELLLVFSQAAQNVADRVHLSFERFFERKGRFPRNKVPAKYNSMTFPQHGFKVNPESGLFLSGAGHVRIFMHRPMNGKVKRLIVKREVHEWYAIFVVEQEAPAKQSLDSISESQIRGIDLGLQKFATLDNGPGVEYPRFHRRSEDRFKSLQSGLARKRRGSRRWSQTLASLSKAHLHVKRQREDWQNKFLSRLFKENDALVVEKLNIEGMLKNHGLAKSISDSSWGKFVRKATFKADMLGKHLIAVDPWGTSQFCYNCLTWVPKTLSERTHHCPNCSIEVPRDLNSARLIKRLGIRSCPPSDGGSSLAELKPLPSLREMASPSYEAGSPRLSVAGGRHLSSHCRRFV